MAKKQLESVTYNTRIRSFPDGSKQYYHSSRNYHRAGEEEREVKRLWDESIIETYKQWYGEEWWIYYASRHSPDYEEDSTVGRKEIDNMKRAVQTVYNIAKSNDFQYFVTFTFNPDVVDSFDYDSCVDAVRQWMNVSRKKKIKWLIVPEQHKSGRYHFHALVAGDMKLKHAVNPHTGMPMMDKSGRPIYNIGDYKWGYTTATEIGDPKRTASYIAKYLAKDITVPKGRKRYWASYGLERPEEEFTTMTDYAMLEVFAKSRYFKDTVNEWGTFWLIETDGETPL